MQTQAMSSCVNAHPCLECHSGDGSTGTTSVRTFPFTIGRVESSDLQINSQRVSRAHAVITKEGSSYRIRDLGSTNGTQLNGQPIEEAELSDGDLLTIGDTELAFLCGSQPSRMQTVAMTAAAGTDAQPEFATLEYSESVYRLRRMREVVLRRALSVPRQVIEGIVDGGKFAARVIPSTNDFECEAAGLLGLPLETAWLWQRHYLTALRTAAVDQSQNAGDSRLLLGLLDTEFGDLEQLRKTLFLAEHTSSGQLDASVEIAVEALLDPAKRSRWDEARQGIQFSYCVRNLDWRHSGLLEELEFSPRFAVLAADVIQRATQVEHLGKKLNQLVECCEGIGCRLVAANLQPSEVADCSRFQIDLAIWNDAEVGSDTSAVMRMPTPV